MKILHTVESYLPSQHGMQEVVKQISERLAARGHRVEIATGWHPNRNIVENINGVLVHSFKITGNSVLGIAGKPEEIIRYVDFILNADYDLVVNFAAQQWASDLAFPILKNIHAKKIFVPTGFSSLFDPKFEDYFESLDKTMQEYDVNIFHSRKYRDFLYYSRLGAENYRIIPNGAAEEEFSNESEMDIRKKLGIRKDAFLILTVGGHQGKGHRESICIFNKARISNCVLVIVGPPLEKRKIAYPIKRALNSILGPFGLLDWKYFRADCPDLCRLAEDTVNRKIAWRIRNKRVIITTLPRNDTVAAFKQADLFLFPSQIECSPIVIYESMAAGLPFLATAAGNTEELAMRSGGGEIIKTHEIKDDAWHRCVADISDGARKLERYFMDKNLAKSIGAKGKSFWMENATWGKISVEYEKIYIETLISAN